jgi:anti-sigma regulatory factor (Ser/Thr protein kinase)
VRDDRAMEGVIAPVSMVFATSIRLDIDEQSQIGAARRCAVALGHTHALSADAVGRLAIVVTEAATNIVRHAGFGVIVLRALLAGQTASIEVLALDKGPGIHDVERAMRDGYSTIATAGRGLGGIQRLAEVFGIYSQRGMGTALLARIGERPRWSSHARPVVSLDDRVGAVCVPLRGEIECGDAWRIVAGPGRISILLVDGLGHGPEAALAANAATTAFPRLASGSPDAALLALDTALRDTRGAALSVAVIDEAARTARFSGVGNVDGRVLAEGATQHLVPQSGIVGHGMPKLRSSDAPWPPGARLVLHSDGILARWRTESYPGLMSAHPALLAGVIYRDFARDRDDATVFVLDNRAAAGRL